MRFFNFALQIKFKLMNFNFLDVWPWPLLFHMPLRWLSLELVPPEPRCTLPHEGDPGLDARLRSQLAIMAVPCVVRVPPGERPPAEVRGLPGCDPPATRGACCCGCGCPAGRCGCTVCPFCTPYAGACIALLLLLPPRSSFDIDRALFPRAPHSTSTFASAPDAAAP